MKYYKSYISAFLIIVCTSSSFANTNGKELFNNLCLSCHVTSGKPTIAPPIFAVINHVKYTYPEKPDFVNYVVEWVENPRQEKALMPGAIKKFGSMPKLPYKTDDVRLIAEYLYDGNVQLPEWYIEHYKAEHGHEPKS